MYTTFLRSCRNWAEFASAEKIIQDEGLTYDYGTAAHSVILEGKMDTFHIRPAKCSDGSAWHGNKTECKEWNATHADRIVLTADEAQTLSDAGHYVRNHPQVQKVLRDGHPEVSAIAGSDRARIDYLRMDGTHARIVDLKTCTDASEAEIQKEILNRGYHIQAAWYRRVLKALGAEFVTVHFIFLQKGKLPLVNVRELSSKAMDLGDLTIAHALDLKLKCEANGFWPEWGDYDGDNSIKTIDLPAWCYPDNEISLVMGGQEVAV